MNLKLSKDINHYEGLITVFAIILAVEYSSETYDLWDIFIGLISIYIGCYGYWEIAKKETDGFYSILTSSIISLGITTITSSIIYMTYSCFYSIELIKSYTFLIENIRFLFFIILIFFIYRKLHK